jgi:hypothetical protein
MGVPKNTPVETLLQLRQSIIDTLSEVMEVNKSWIRPFFPADLLDEAPAECQTIYVRLDTAIFHSLASLSKAQRTTAALAHVIWEAFEGRFEVEVFIGDLNPDWRTLVKARE